MTGNFPGDGDADAKSSVKGGHHRPGHEIGHGDHRANGHRAQEVPGGEELSLLGGSL